MVRNTEGAAYQMIKQEILAGLYGAEAAFDSN